MVPVDDIVRPAGSPIAENVYGPPEPPLPTIVTGAIGTPWTAVMATQFAVGGGTQPLTTTVAPELVRVALFVAVTVAPGFVYVPQTSLVVGAVTCATTDAFAATVPKAQLSV